MRSTRSRAKKRPSDGEPPAVAETQAKVVRPRRPAVRLRRGLVLESMVRHFVTNNVVDVAERSGHAFTINIASIRMWRFMFVNGQYAAHFINRLFAYTRDEWNVLADSKVVASRARTSIHGLFGFGCRMHGSMVGRLLAIGRFPLVGQLVGKSLDDAEFSWLIPALRFDLTILEMPTAYALDFVNRYVRELKLVVTAHSVELLVDLMANLRTLFPNCHRVECVFLYAEPPKSTPHASFRTERLRSFVVDLKAKRISIERLVETMRAEFFVPNGAVEFDVQIGYAERTAWADEMRAKLKNGVIPKKRLESRAFSTLLEEANARVRVTRTSNLKVDYTHTRVLHPVGIFRRTKIVYAAAK
ncbi:hypothetical protein M3Y99_00602800 [Aphelenchoides fujianensis]|nr:hypothetical protein M3Y99_00602800 [Aphelenchoides fujianensis]